MGLFSFSSHQKEVALIVDVGSASVGASFALISSEPKTQPVITGSARIPLEFQEHLRFDRFVNLMLGAVEASILSLVKISKEKPESIHCFMASPWYASQVRKTSLKKNKKFVFTDELFNSLVNEEAKRFQEEEVANYARLKEHTYFIEKQVVDVSLNGYHMENPFGVTAQNAELSVFFSIAPEHIVIKIRERIEKILPHRPIVFHTFLLPFFTTIRDIFNEHRDFLLIDVGGEVTDIALIKDQNIKESISFPLGRNFVLRRSAELFKKSIEEMRSLFFLMTEGKLEASVKEKTAKIFFLVRQEWLKMFHEALLSISSKTLLPNAVFLASDADVLRWFMESIMSEEYGQYALSAEKFTVIPVGLSVLSKHILFDGTIEKDQFMALEALYLAKRAKKI